MRPHVVAWLDSFLPHWSSTLLAPTWFTCVGLAGLVTLFVMRAVARRHGVDRRTVATIVLWCYVAAVAAGIVVPAAIDAIERLFATGHFTLRWAGMTSFWGYLAGVTAVALVCRKHDVALPRFADLCAAPLGLALMFARLGCFLGGCDYGKVTSLPWGVRFPRGSPAWHDHVQAGLLSGDRAQSLPVHPTQLYEAVLGLAIAGIALVLGRTAWARSGRGRVFVVAAGIYAVGRIAIEALRGDLGRGIYGGVSSGQLFSIAVLVVIVGGLVVTRRRMVGGRAAAVAVVVAVIAGVPSHAHAQIPAPSPTPGPAVPGPAVAPPEAPAAAPSSPQPRPAVSRGAQTRDESALSGLQVGALVGIATAINRRAEQVSTLGGPSLSVGYALGELGLWFDLDSYGNADATHGTMLVSASWMRRTGKLRLGGRIGFGATLVNFDEPAFRDVAGTTARFESLADYTIHDRWLLEIRPIAIDILTAADLGGPITTLQIRVGIAYQFGGRTNPRPSSPPTAPAYPAYPNQYPPVPYPYPPTPYPYPRPYPSPTPPPTTPYPTPPPATTPYPPPTPPSTAPPATSPSPPPPTPAPAPPTPSTPQPSPAPAPRSGS